MYQCVIIGSGFSGICMAIKLKAAGIHDYIILEKAKAIGGTWRENTYPGAECDIPSALYSYSFEPYPDWNFKWSEQKQILHYLNYCVDKYDIHKNIRFKAKVKQASFDTVSASWNIGLDDGASIQAKTLVSAIGQLHHPLLPDIKGIEDFKHASFHSAEWNHDLDLKDKQVAVIGNGASAIQFIPKIAKDVAKLDVYQRSAKWVIRKQDRAYFKWEKSLFKKLPFLKKVDRFRIWLSAGLLYTVSIQSKAFNFIVKWKTKWNIRRSIKDPSLRKALIPNYAPGAKRTLFSDNYYKALNEEHVHLVQKPIEAIAPDGIKTTDNLVASYDHIIYATGFQSNPFLQHINIVGLNNQSLKDKWKAGEKSYLGITTHGFPNFFMMYGPNTNLGHNSIVIMSEAQANYIVQGIKELDNSEHRYLDVKAAVEEKFDQEIQRRLAKSIWASVSDSWYKNGDRIPNNWPGRTLEYQKRTKKLKLSDYTFSV